MKLNGLNDQLMATAALRYCLGRRTYIVGACVEWVRETWDEFTSDTRRSIIQDTRRAMKQSLAGDAIDVENWKELLNWALEQEK